MHHLFLTGCAISPPCFAVCCRMEPRRRSWRSCITTRYDGRPAWRRHRRCGWMNARARTHQLKCRLSRSRCGSFLPWFYSRPRWCFNASAISAFTRYLSRSTNTHKHTHTRTHTHTHTHTHTNKHHKPGGQTAQSHTYTHTHTHTHTHTGTHAHTHTRTHTRTRRSRVTCSQLTGLCCSLPHA